MIEDCYAAIKAISDFTKGHRISGLDGFDLVVSKKPEVERTLGCANNAKRIDKLVDSRRDGHLRSLPLERLRRLHRDVKLDKLVLVDGKRFALIGELGHDRAESFLAAILDRSVVDLVHEQNAVAVRSGLSDLLKNIVPVVLRIDHGLAANLGNVDHHHEVIRLNRNV